MTARRSMETPPVGPQRCGLVLGASRQSFSTKAVRQAGLAAVVCQTMPEALRALRRRATAVVLVVVGAGEVDAVEAVLNVRDVAEAVPVLVLMAPRRKHDAVLISALPGAQVLRTDATVADVAARIAAAVGGNDKRDNQQKAETT